MVAPGPATRRRILGGSLVGALALGALVALGWGRWSASPNAGASSPSASQAGDPYESARSLLVPTAFGGWSVALPDDQDQPGPWLLAAATIEDPVERAAAIDAALGPAAALVGADATDRSVPLAAAIALQRLASPDEGQRRLLRDIVDGAAARLGAGDAGWVGPLLQASRTSGAEGAIATDALRGIAGTRGCDDLTPGGSLPAPDGILTVLVRVLVVDGRTCDGAADLTATAVDDPAWQPAQYAQELADLATLAGPLPASTTEALTSHLQQALVPGDDAVVASSVPSTAPTVLGAADALHLEVAVPEALEAWAHHQAEHRGRLPQQIDGPPSMLDVAVLRQLAGRGLVPPSWRSDTAAAVEVGTAPKSRLAASVVVDRQVPPCDDATLVAARSGSAGERATVEVSVADGVLALVAARCEVTDGAALDLEAVLRATRRHADPDGAALRTWAALTAACALDPSLLTPDLAGPVPTGGAFDDDPAFAIARAYSSDPVAGCAADRAR